MNWKEQKWKELEDKADSVISYCNFKSKMKIYFTKEDTYGLLHICESMNVDYEYIDFKKPEDILSFVNNKDGIILIDESCDQRCNAEIEQKLNSYGLMNNFNYFFINDRDIPNFMSEIFPIIYAKIYKGWYVPRVQVTITTRCTLKCRDCGNGCNHWDRTDKSNDLTYDETKEAVDSLFNKATFVDIVNMLGGEPLLCQDILERIYPYIKEKYGKKYRKLGLFTNSTVIPTEKTLKVLKDCDVYLCISDYSAADKNTTKNMGHLLYLLKVHGIKYIVFHEKIRWFNYQLYDVEHTVEEADKIRESCITQYPYLRCPEAVNDTFYVCSMAYVTLKSKKMDVNRENGMKISEISDVLRAVKYNRGLDEDIKSCQYCNGFAESKLLSGIQEEE